MIEAEKEDVQYHRPRAELSCFRAKCEVELYYMTRIWAVLASFHHLTSLILTVHISSLTSGTLRLILNHNRCSKRDLLYP
jgi:hypothetical protein